VNVKSDFSGFSMIYSWKFLVLEDLRDGNGGFGFEFERIGTVGSPNRQI
jgi:hypothetical protein